MEDSIHSMQSTQAKCVFVDASVRSSHVERKAHRLVRCNAAVCILSSCAMAALQKCPRLPVVCCAVMSKSDGLSYSCLPTSLPTCLPAFLLAFSPPYPLLSGPDSMIVRLALAAHSKLVGAMLDMGLQQGEAAFKQHISLQVRTTQIDLEVWPLAPITLMCRRIP